MYNSFEERKSNLKKIMRENFVYSSCDCSIHNEIGQQFPDAATHTNTNTNASMHAYV